MKKILLCWIAVALVLISLSPLDCLAQLSVPLTVKEALPQGVTGINRAMEPVTVGIPLAEDAAITSVSKLGVSGVSAGQFRPLAWWPNGNIRWVLVDFMTDVAAGATRNDISLTYGSGNFGGNAMAADNGSAITVQTGGAQFTLRKSGFNIFDSVTVDGQQLVAPGNTGRVLARDVNGVEFTSVNDAATSVVIDENGPVRSVVKASGALKNSSGTRLIDYTLYLHFYRGKSYVKGFVVLRNASKFAPVHALFTSAELVVPLSLGAGVSVDFARKTDVVTRTMQPTDTAFLFQGYSTAYNIPEHANCYLWDPPLNGTCTNNVFTYDSSAMGMKIQVGAETINNPGNNQEWSAGYSDLRDSTGKGVAVAFRWLAANYPGGFGAKGDGESSIQLFSPQNIRTLKLLFGKHEYREVLWDFHATGMSSSNSLYALQYPLLARAPFEHYRDTGAVFGQKELVSEAEQQQFFALMGKISPSLANPIMNTVYRAWYWPMTGGDNQIDFPLGNLLDYLRTGASGWYLLGEQRTLFNASTAVEHSDNFGMEAVAQQQDPLPASKGISGPFYDLEHANAGSIPLYYFISGNEAIKESFIDYGESVARPQVIWHMFPESSYTRAMARVLRNLSLAYEFSCQMGNCNSIYKNELEQGMNKFLDMRDNPSLTITSPKGRNMTRGYLYLDTTISESKRLVHSFFHTQILYEGLWQLHRVMLQSGWNYSRMEDFDDMLTGYSRFIFDEYIADLPQNNSSQFKFGFIYDYPLDEASINPSANMVASAERAAVWGYGQTGEQSYLEKAAHLVWEGTVYATARTPAELQEQVLMHAYLNKAGLQTWQEVPLTVTPNGNGSYTMTWTAPGALRQQIKYSDKPIVDWLGFNKTSRTYQYDPAQYTAWFAATNINNEPTPGLAGEAQQYTISGLDPTRTYHFAMKAFGKFVPQPKIKGILIQ